MIPKFRVWDKNNKCMHEVRSIWIEDDFPLNSHVVYSLGNTVEVIFDDVELMQSTGLKDKSAKYEINNKDILLVDTFPESSFKAKVVYETGSFGVVALKGDIVDYFPKHWNDTFMPLAELYWIFDCEDGVLDCVEILGNEFENPELLEEQR